LAEANHAICQLRKIFPGEGQLRTVIVHRGLISSSCLVFSHQGYFVIAVNPTGSNTFGQKFVDAITKDWGGAPFVDLKKGFDHVLKTFPEVSFPRHFFFYVNHGWTDLEYRSACRLTRRKQSPLDTVLADIQSST
jgi:hypothetical protein